MYTQRVTFFPAIGKGPELRPILEERARLRQAQGVRANLQTTVFAGEQRFNLNLQVDDLGALDAVRAKPLPVDTRIAPLTRQPNHLSLYENLLAAQAAPTPARYIQRISRMPLPGKGRELIALVLERAKARQAEGIRTSISVQVAGAASGTLVTNLIFTSLAELEKQRARNQTDAAQQQFQATVATLAGPNRVEIFETLVPFQPR